MTLSREDLARRFGSLDVALAALEASGATEEELWSTVEVSVHVPASSIADADRRWWWQQLYELLENHRLTELTQLPGGTKIEGW